MTKKVCISGYYGFDNFGDEIILKTLIENLKKYQPDIDITVFSSNPEKTSKELSVKSIHSFNIKQVIKVIKNCDCLISGGGSLLQDSTSKKSLIYYLFILISAQFFKKKTIIFAQGIGPINNSFLKHLTLNIIKKAVYVTVRDEKSHSFLNKYGINACLCTDPVWNIKINNKIKTEKIGLQIRNVRNISDEFLSVFAKAINNYYANKEILILSLQNTIDLDICNKLKDKITSINPNINIKVIENTSNEKMTECISSLKELIAMRYHACLIGIKAGVKVLPVSYDIKVETLAKEFNLRYIDIKDTKNISATIDEFINKEYKVKNNIEEKLYDFEKLIDKI